MNQTQTMSTKHTPGPWVIRERTGRLHITPADNEFCLCAAASGFDSNEAQANARLIAAAPALLEACKTAVEDAMRAGVHHTMPLTIALLKQAIAAAEGEL